MTDNARQPAQTPPAANENGVAVVLCISCQGKKTLPVFNIRGEYLRDVDCPQCGGSGHES